MYPQLELGNLIQDSRNRVFKITGIKPNDTNIRGIIYERYLVEPITNIDDPFVESFVEKSLFHKELTVLKTKIAEYLYA